MEKGKIKLRITATLILMIWLFLLMGQVLAATQVLTVGSRGSDVIELQSGLSSLGYDVGLIDGIFGFQTKQAVLDFQARYGLDVDGVAGFQTLSKLKELTSNGSPAGAIFPKRAGPP